MDEMNGYIFGRLQASEDTAKRIGKTLRKQAGTNRRIAVLIWAAAVCMIAMDIRSREQGEKIKKLCDAIEELKRTKGD